MEYVTGLGEIEWLTESELAELAEELIFEGWGEWAGAYVKGYLAVNPERHYGVLTDEEIEKDMEEWEDED